MTRRRCGALIRRFGPPPGLLPDGSSPKGRRVSLTSGRR
jgi:hypothetical protein